MAEEIFLIKGGKAYFLDELETGVFYPVIGFRGKNNPGHSVYEYDRGIGKLILGHDIAEIPNRNISILLRVEEEGFFILSSIIHECIKIAEISSHDYIGVEFFGSKMGRLVGIEGKTKLIEIKPRFFKKLDREEGEDI